MLPLLQGTRLIFRCCGLVSLAREICVPKGIVKEVKNEPALRDLHPLRIMVPTELVSEERWKSMKAHPVLMLDSSKGSLSFHRRKFRS